MLIPACYFGRRYYLSKQSPDTDEGGLKEVNDLALGEGEAISDKDRDNLCLEDENSAEKFFVQDDTSKAKRMSLEDIEIEMADGGMPTLLGGGVVGGKKKSVVGKESPKKASGATSRPRRESQRGNNDMSDDDSSQIKGNKLRESVFGVKQGSENVKSHSEKEEERNSVKRGSYRVRKTRALRKRTNKW